MMYGKVPIWLSRARNVVTSLKLESCAVALSHAPKMADGKIISELAKMIGITPEWLMRSGR